MTHLEILIPFSLPPAEHAKDLVKMLTSECGTNGLATLLSRNQSLVRKQFDDFLPELPHEQWLNRQYPVLQRHANAAGVNLTPGHWFIVNPVHLHIARNHLVLTDYRQLNLSKQDSLHLFETAKIRCNEVGVDLVYGNAATWFLRCDDWEDFVTSSPDATCGHNIEIWSAKGTKELAWRKLQNEIQMEWFIHPIQQQREEHGEKVINGLWLWAGTRVTADAAIQFKKIITPSSADKLILSPDLILLDQLSCAALTNDWGTWAALMIELEHNWFKPLCTALKSRKLNQAQLHFSNSNTLLSIHASRNALYKFWRIPTFNHLMT